MALKPSVFPKSDFEITEGAYKITNPHFAIPNPAAFIKDDDPNREEKLAKIDQFPPKTIVQLDLLELDAQGDVVDANVIKPLRLGFAKNTEKARPADEDSDDISTGYDARGSVGRYAVPNTYSPHASTPAGFFLEKLRDSAGLPEDRFPDNNDLSFLEGLCVRIRPIPQPLVKRKNDDGTEEEGKGWNQYEPYEIIEDPAATPVKSTPAPAKPAAAKTVAKPATAAAAAKPAAAAKSPAAAAKPAAAPAPAKAAAPAPAAPAAASAIDDETAVATALDILSTTLEAMNKAGTATTPSAVKVRLIQHVMKLEAAMQAAVGKYTKDLAWITEQLGG